MPRNFNTIKLNIYYRENLLFNKAGSFFLKANAIKNFVCIIANLYKTNNYDQKDSLINLYYLVFYAC
jgi:hypothetical protein